MHQAKSRFLFETSSPLAQFPLPCFNTRNRPPGRSGGTHTADAAEMALQSTATYGTRPSSAPAISAAMMQGIGLRTNKRGRRVRRLYSGLRTQGGRSPAPWRPKNAMGIRGRILECHAP